MQNPLLHEICSDFIDSWKGAIEVYSVGRCDTLPTYSIE
jgi:hypothetical protein